MGRFEPFGASTIDDDGVDQWLPFPEHARSTIYRPELDEHRRVQIAPSDGDRGRCAGFCWFERGRRFAVVREVARSDVSIAGPLADAIAPGRVEVDAGRRHVRPGDLHQCEVALNERDRQADGRPATVREFDDDLLTRGDRRLVDWNRCRGSRRRPRSRRCYRPHARSGGEQERLAPGPRHGSPSGPAVENLRDGYDRSSTAGRSFTESTTAAAPADR